MRKTLFIKIFLGFLFIIFLFLFLIVYYSVNNIKKWNEHNLVEQLHKIAITLRPSISSFLSEGEDQIDDFVNKMGKSLQIRITVIDAEGRVVGDSEVKPETMENHGDRPDFLKALRGEESKELRFSSTLRSKMLYLGIPISHRGSIIGVLRVSMFVQNITLFSNTIRNRIFFMAFTLFLLSIIFTFFIAKKVSQPIKKMVEASRKVSQGDYSTRVFSTDRGELGELALSFNEMVEHLGELFQKISASREELQTIIESIKESLLVIDHEGTIVLTNKNFDQMVGHKNSEQKKYWEVCRNTNFYNFVQNIIREKKSFSGQLELSGKIYVTSFNFLQSQKRIVITFHDISEIKQLETIKRDFIINASHELKTPLTSIKGFVETLEQESNKSSQKYLSIIKRNTNRLILIVQDLLLLSRIEDKTFIRENKNIFLKKLLNSIRLQFAPILKKKNLTFSLEIEDNLPPIKGDPFRLEDMFVNLLDNAIKYTEKGEISIRIKKENNRIRCDIQDTGIGIPKKYQERIFERFFTVDSSRSKETGGTGLGLSIVKHIVLMHNGTIEVKSALNQGTTFIIRFHIS